MMDPKCANCFNETYYYCVKCSVAVCNRPSCSSPVAPTVLNYSEAHPKKVSECKKCLAELDKGNTRRRKGNTQKCHSDSKQQQISSFFTQSPRYVQFMVEVCINFFIHFFLMIIARYNNIHYYFNLFLVPQIKQATAKIVNVIHQRILVVLLLLHQNISMTKVNK